MQICTLTLWAIDRLIAMSLLCGIEFDSSLGLSDKELPLHIVFTLKRFGSIQDNYLINKRREKIDMTIRE